MKVVVVLRGRCIRLQTNGQALKMGVLGSPCDKGCLAVDTARIPLIIAVHPS